MKTALKLLLLLLIVAGAAAVLVVPNLRSGHDHRLCVEGNTVGQLKTINVAQALFREGDKDEDGTLDYGTIAQLGSCTLIDATLASGTKDNYLFRCAPSTSTPEFLWWATAEPRPLSSGQHDVGRWFATNQASVIWASTTGPITVDPATCDIDTRTAVIVK